MSGIPATTSGSTAEVDDSDAEVVYETPTAAVINGARNDGVLSEAQEVQLEHANELRKLGFENLAEAVEFQVATDLVNDGLVATYSGSNGEDITGTDVFNDEAAAAKFDAAFLSLEGTLKGGESIKELQNLNLAAAHFIAGCNPAAEPELSAAIDKLNDAQTDKGKAIALIDLSAMIYCATAVHMGDDADAVGTALTLLEDTATHKAFLLMAGGAINIASLSIVIDMLNNPNKTAADMAIMNQAKAGLDSVGTKVSEGVTMLMKLINEA
jgi:hypothetical protein